MKNGRKQEIYKIALAIILLFLGLVCFSIPGMRFSGKLSVLCSGISLLSVFLSRAAEKQKYFKCCKVILHYGVLGAFLLLSLLEVHVLRVGLSDMAAIPADAVIVLGAGVNGRTPSLALQTRINQAAEYLQTYPELPVVLSGGQGAGEEISEAQAMYEALLAQGIEPERLFLEERSRNTKENLEYSVSILENETGFTPGTDRVAIVTNDFHMARTQMLAKKWFSIEVVGIPAKLPWWWLNANYYLREPFAIVKAWIF